MKARAQGQGSNVSSRTRRMRLHARDPVVPASSKPRILPATSSISELQWMWVCFASCALQLWMSGMSEAIRMHFALHIRVSCSWAGILLYCSFWIPHPLLFIQQQVIIPSSSISTLAWYSFKTFTNASATYTAYSWPAKNWRVVPWCLTS